MNTEERPVKTVTELIEEVAVSVLKCGQETAFGGLEMKKGEKEG